LGIELLDELIWTSKGIEIRPLPKCPLGNFRKRDSGKRLAIGQVNLSIPLISRTFIALGNGGRSKTSHTYAYGTKGKERWEKFKKLHIYGE
jgi:hypothetical protein